MNIYKYYLNLIPKTSILILLENFFTILTKYLEINKIIKNDKQKLNDKMKKYFNKEVKANEENYYYSLIFKIAEYKYIIDKINNKNIVKHILNDYFMKRTIRNYDKVLLNKKEQFSKKNLKNQIIEKELYTEDDIIKIVKSIEIVDFGSEDFNTYNDEYKKRLECLIYDINFNISKEINDYENYKLIDQKYFKNNNQNIPDCGETLLLNIVNLLVYNKKYIIKEDNIIYSFYKKNSTIKIQQLNNNLHDEWSKIVSSLNNIKYNNKTYEIIPTITNIINILNIIFSIKNSSNEIIILNESDNDIENIKKNIDIIFKEVNFTLEYNLSNEEQNIYDLYIPLLNLKFIFTIKHGESTFTKNKNMNLNKLGFLLKNNTYNENYYLKNIYRHLYYENIYNCKNIFDFLHYNNIIEIYLFDLDKAKKIYNNFLTPEIILNFLNYNKLFTNTFFINHLFHNNHNILHQIILTNNYDINNLEKLLQKYFDLVDELNHKKFIMEFNNNNLIVNYLFRRNLKNGTNTINESIYEIYKIYYDKLEINKLINLIPNNSIISGYEIDILYLLFNEEFINLYNNKFISCDNIIHIYNYILNILKDTSMIMIHNFILDQKFNIKLSDPRILISEEYKPIILELRNNIKNELINFSNEYNKNNIEKISSDIINSFLKKI